LSGQYRLPEEMRAELAKPLGRLFKPAEISGAAFLGTVKDAAFVVTVGDRVTETFGKTGRTPEVQIVDSMENRKPRLPPEVSFVANYVAENPPATITEAAMKAIKGAFDGPKPARVLVVGEEDLLAIPAIVMAPDSASVFYGQPGQGIVLVKADRAAKERSKALLRRMGFPKIP
jgi:GTP-dependent dephospho-CoA kinase